MYIAKENYVSYFPPTNLLNLPSEDYFTYWNKLINVASHRQEVSALSTSGKWLRPELNRKDSKIDPGRMANLEWGMECVVRGDKDCERDRERDNNDALASGERCALKERAAADNTARQGNPVIIKCSQGVTDQQEQICSI